MKTLEPTAIRDVTFQHRIMFPALTTGNEAEDDSDALNALFESGEMDQVRARLLHDMPFFADEVTEEALLAMCGPPLLENYKASGVEPYTRHAVTRIQSDDLLCEDQSRNVAMAIGTHSVAFDTAARSAKNFAVIKIGNCSEAANISHAIQTGTTQPMRFSSSRPAVKIEALRIAPFV